MSKDDNAGLFSKVVKFVKNPTTSWADLDQPEAERESGYSKQMLKEMIERKRRNDFVRKREFDMLRKLRRSEAMAGHDLAARPSFFQSSMPSKPDDRATTLKKIDEIEAQMSMQWWKTKGADSITSTGSPGPNSAAQLPGSLPHKGREASPTRPAPQSPTSRAFRPLFGAMSRAAPPNPAAGPPSGNSIRRCWPRNATSPAPSSTQSPPTARSSSSTSRYTAPSPTVRR